MTSKNQRTVTLNAAAHAEFARYAQAEGVSVAAWLTRAGEERRRRESARAYAELMRDPEVLAELAPWRAAAAERRAARDARLLAMGEPELSHQASEGAA